ncbi:MAG: ribosome maturation factor RimM [Ornithinimicrobium sp.]
MSQSGLRVARVGKPHGLRGEVTVQVHTDEPQERLRVGALLRAQGVDDEPLEIETVRVHQGRYLIGFVGVHDRDGAELLRNTTLYADVAIAPMGETPEGGYYEGDLIGMQVLTRSGDVVGTVTGLHTRPAQDLLEISRPDGPTVQVPFVHALVPEVDSEQRRVVIDPPAGLLDLEG